MTIYIGKRMYLFCVALGRISNWQPGVTRTLCCVAKRADIIHANPLQPPLPDNLHHLLVVESGAGEWMVEFSRIILQHYRQ